MLEMILIIVGIGTAVIALIIAALEWQALIGYWRGSRDKHL
jgi:hypothetical protein